MNSVVWHGIEINIISPASNLFLSAIMDAADTDYSVSAALDWFASVAKSKYNVDIAVDLDVCERTVRDWRKRLGLPPLPVLLTRSESEMAVSVPARVECGVNGMNACSERRCRLYGECFYGVKSNTWKGVHYILPCEAIVSFELDEHLIVTNCRQL